MHESNSNNAKISYDVILYMMHIAFIEIRAAEKIGKCKGLADIFHNVPNRISIGISADDIIDHIYVVAKRRGQEEYINWLVDHSIQKIENRKNK